MTTTTTITTSTTSTGTAGSVAARSRRTRRFAQALGAVAVAGGVALTNMAPVHALPTGGGGGGGSDPTATWDATVLGSINLSGCTATAAQVTVRITGQANGLNLNTYPTKTAVTGSRITFQADGMPHTTLFVWATVNSASCVYGSWSTNPLPVSVPITPNVVVSNANVTYTAPHKVTVVPGFLLAGGARTALNNLSVVLNDFGPQHGVSHQLDNSSSISLDGVNRTAFTIPETNIKLQQCLFGICVPLGAAKFYVNDMRSNSVTFNWLPTGSLQFAVGFESSGREIKGFYDSFTTGSQDSLMPDAQIDNAVLTTQLVPKLDGHGGITLGVSGTPTMSASIAATGPCVVFGWDACNSLLGYQSTIRSIFTGQLAGQLNSASVQTLIAAQIRPVLTAAGIGTVKGVFVQGDNIIITE